MRRWMVAMVILLVAAGTQVVFDKEAQAGFSYNPAGDLVPGSGEGNPDDTVYVPQMRFPIESGTAYANSQVWGHGGMHGPGGGECHENNYSYPWHDNFCETRWQNVSFCPGSGDAHQGQDIRPATCADRTHWVVSATDGTVTSIGSYTVWIQDSSGMTHRYMHMAMNALEVTTGQTVQKGQRLGLVSNDFGGSPTTIHLHYDINQGGTYLNPYMSLVESYKDANGESEPQPQPQPTFELDLDVRISGLDDFYSDGSSQGVPDALGGDRFQAEILMTNHSEDRLGTTQIGFSVDDPFAKIVDYAIYSDHPEYDQQSWEVNSADPSEGSENPASLGASGHLEMHGFAPQETKRVVLELEAGHYSIGQMERSPKVRTWLTSAEPGGGVEADVVFTGHSGGWDDSASGSSFADQVRAQASFDVLSRDEWLFDSRRHAADLEGWDVCYQGHHDRLIHNQNVGALALKVAGDSACVVSPSWTRIDADHFDEMVIEVRGHNGWHNQALLWGDGQGVIFEAPGDGEFHRLVVPLRGQPGWTGEIRELRLMPLYGEAPASGDSPWHDIGALYFQNSSTGQTSSDGQSSTQGTSVEAHALGSTVGANSGTGGGASSPTNGASNFTTETSTCASVSGGGAGEGLLVLLVLLGLVGLRRRRQKGH